MQLDAALAVQAGVDQFTANILYQQFYNNAYLASGWTGNVAADGAGSLSPDYLAAIQNELNCVRELAGDPGVVALDPALNAEDQQAALMMSANNALNHFPPSTWADYSAAGADGAGHSNLALDVSGAEAILDFLVDPGPNNTIVGHRRNILDPLIGTMGWGEVDPASGFPASAANYIDYSNAFSAPITGVAWPTNGAFPLPWLPDGMRWSFQTDSSSADFSHATVSVTQNGVPQVVSIIDAESPTNHYNGTAIVWTLPSTATGEQAAAYDVNISNVLVNGQPQDFSYTTTTFNPNPVRAAWAFAMPNPSSDPTAITAGPDGNLWFTEPNANKIGMINPTTHAITEFPIPSAASGADAITAGPDGNLWFTEPTANKIAMISPTTHAVAEFPIPSANSDPTAITAGPDGNLWFTERNVNKIGMINPTTHAITEFPIATAPGEPTAITAGPDGNLWFIEPNTNRIGTISPTTHAIASFPIPTAMSYPTAIAAGADGNLWFTEVIGNRIGMINPTTHAITEFPLTTALGEPNAITAGPDGNLWFTEGSSQFGMINPTTHAITEFPAPILFSAAQGDLLGITAGPDGNLWFTEMIGDPIFLYPPAATTPTPTPTVSPRPRPSSMSAPPQVVGSVAVSRPKKHKGTEYTITFAAPLDPTSALEAGRYRVSVGVNRRQRKHQRTVRTRTLAIRSVAYNPGPGTVVITLARAHKGAVEITIEPGLEAADGATTSSRITLAAP